MVVWFWFFLLLLHKIIYLHTTCLTVVSYLSEQFLFLRIDNEKALSNPLFDTQFTSKMNNNTRRIVANAP